MIVVRFLAPLIVVTLALIAVQPGPPGTADDAFLPDLDGGSHALREAAWSGRVRLVSFIAIWPARPADRPDPNRSQAVFTRSMGLQFAGEGLKTRIVAVSRTGVTPGQLRNVGLAWGSDVAEFVADPREAVARSYGVDRYPTTLLLDTRDRVVNRWEGFASAHELASAIRDCLATVDHPDGVD